MYGSIKRRETVLHEAHMALERVHAAFKLRTLTLHHVRAAR
jgi:hypothetical protein